MAAATTRPLGNRKVGTWPILMAIALAAGFASCDGADGPTEPEDAIVLSPELTVSDPAHVSGGSGSLAAATPAVAYISASPGTYADITKVTITNLANGRSQTVTVVLGGFDPVALEAEPGDELEILLHHSDDSITRYITIVPARRRPRVVRTVPPKDATQVIVEASVLVVFTEPVDGSTVTAENFRLELDGEPVEGTFRLSDDGLRTSFLPGEPLQRGTTYSLVITTGVLDLDGDPLKEQVLTTFTTEPVQVQLCAKKAVIDEINGIVESDDPDWQGPEVNSTGPSCGVPGRPYDPYGTLTYYREGPTFTWEFRGAGFENPRVVYDGYAIIWHHYVLVYYPDPWSGENLVCLAGVGGPVVRTDSWYPDSEGNLRASGSYDFGMDLNDAKIWIVRADWVDCTGSDNIYWNNPDSVPRLTNDRNGDGEVDATESLKSCFPVCGYGEGTLIYDWLFETELINYHDTNG